MNTVRCILMLGLFAYAARVAASTVVDMKAEGYIAGHNPRQLGRCGGKAADKIIQQLLRERLRIGGAAGNVADRY